MTDGTATASTVRGEITVDIGGSQVKVTPGQVLRTNSSRLEDGNCDLPAIHVTARPNKTERTGTIEMIVT